MLSKLRRRFSYLHIIESILASLYFRFPGKRLTVIGVTGTDGKTTTTTLIHHLLTEAGYKTGIMSTLASLHTTTPGRWRVQKFLAQCVKNGCTHAVLEVTSIAIDQYRTWGTPFSIGVLTNIAQNEHLDYHKHFEAYRAAKLKFLASCQSVVLNLDDSASEYYLEHYWKKFPGQKHLSYGLLNPADYQPSAIKYTPTKTTFTLNGKKYETQLLGEFNVLNCLAALATVNSLGIDLSVLKSGLRSFPPPSGRLEVVTKTPFSVIVDFAHTPQAFGRVLPVARLFLKKKTNRLIHVFGATGDRDKNKRPVMAEIASKIDDVIILTHEDTYHEDPREIISQLDKGIDRGKFQEGKNFFRLYDRREAIQTALTLAEPGDVVILTGVGHQKTMNLGGKEVPWSDQKVATELLKKNGK